MNLLTLLWNRPIEDYAKNKADTQHCLYCVAAGIPLRAGGLGDEPFKHPMIPHFIDHGGNEYSKRYDDQLAAMEFFGRTINHHEPIF